MLPRPAQQNGCRLKSSEIKGFPSYTGSCLRQFDARRELRMGYARVMSEKDKATGMKSAYELALERMEEQGIERPRGEEFSDALREKIAEVRNQAEAKLAELEILHRDRLKGLFEHDARREEEEEYVRERRRIEENRDQKIEKLRGEA